jgi:DNA (cytosine-5)-methyltransferase 1
MIDLFSGIGGFRIIAEKYGYTPIGYSEINKVAIDYYKKNFNTQKEFFLGDITKIEENIFSNNIDLITAGVPCQSWSIAGKNGGFNDDRGKLWFHTFRMLDIYTPKSFIFENVKGLYDPRNKEALNTIKNEISKRNYYFDILLLNSNDYGSVQIRKRIFIVGFKCKSDLKAFKKNILLMKHNNVYLGDIINKPFSKDHLINKFIFTDVRGGDNTIHSWDIINTTNKEKMICNLILKNRRKNKYGEKDGNPMTCSDLHELNNSINKKDLEELVNKKILRKIGNKYDFVNSKISSGINGIYRVYSPSSTEFATITASNQNDYIAKKSFSSKEDFINNIYNKNNYRKPTREELLKIQGFSSDFILPEKRHSFQKLIGNSVPLNLIELIISSIN